jgi:ABC-type branched-subunit amino acid transport system substrate-binding protein
MKRLACIALVIAGALMIVPRLVAQHMYSETAGITDNQILIGSCAVLDGPAMFLGRQTIVGATAYLDQVNATGGVHGRKIQLLAFDDGYEPAKAELCFNRLVKEHVFAAGFFVGTPTAAKYVPRAEDERIPLIGLFSGAQLIYVPLKHYVFNVRASYFDETHEQVDNLWNVMGVRKIGVIYQEDVFGSAVLDGLQLALRKYHAVPTGTGTFQRNTLDVDKGIASVRAANPEAVLLVGPYAPVAAIVKRAHAQGWNPIFITVSFVGTEKFIAEAGKDAEGTIITQVIPPYTRTELPAIAAYRKAMSTYYPNEPLSYVSLEGYLDAMVLVEGLKRAGRDLTRQKLVEAVESIYDKDVGMGPKLVLKYSSSRHKGFDQIFTTVVRNGKAEPVDDWKTLVH